MLELFIQTWVAAGRPNIEASHRDRWFDRPMCRFVHKADGGVNLDALLRRLPEGEFHSDGGIATYQFNTERSVARYSFEVR